MYHTMYKENTQNRKYVKKVQKQQKYKKTYL